MKFFTQLAAIAIVASSLVFANSSTVSAQAPTNHLFHVHTWYMNAQLDSTTRAERDALLLEYHTKVTMNNEFILHQWTMNHYYTDDSREFITINEYASWNDIDKANNREDELAKKAWPDSKQRGDFMKKMNSYFSSHKDAIYSGMPKLTK